jgi:hypothetical protein
VEEYEYRMYQPIHLALKLLRGSIRISSEVTKIILREVSGYIIVYSDIMATSKGRDKIFSLYQYIIDLYVKCMSASDMYGDYVKMDLIYTVRAAKLVKDNISSGRKCFKFLKFIDEYNAFIELFAKGGKIEVGDFKKRAISWLSKLTKFCGIFYYLFDNFVWIADMGAIRKEFIHKFGIDYRNVKDMFSLLKNSCETFKSLINANISFTK